jgi:hypothetical protein
MTLHEHSPALAFDEEITGTGKLVRGTIAIIVHSFRVWRSKYDNLDLWHFEAVAADDRQSWSNLLRAGYGTISFEGITRHEVALRIPYLDFLEQSGQRFEANATEVIVGATELEGGIVERQQLDLRLWPTPLALPEVDNVFRWWTGEIRADDAIPRVEATPWLVPLGVGNARFSRRYAWEEARVGGERSTVRVPYASLSLATGESRRSLSPLEVSDIALREAEDVMSVLSLLSRRHVRVSRITVTTRYGPPVPNFGELSRIRASPASARPDRRERALVNPHRMPPTALATLVERYRGLPFKDALASAIIYLVVARDSEFVEARLTNAYTAFEAIVSAVGEHLGTAQALGGSAFAALAKRVRAEVKRFATERSLTDEVLASLIAKVPELQRAPIAGHAAQLLTRNNVEWRDLWASGTDLHTALAAAYGRRSRFIHAGQIGSIGQAAIDASRITILAERFALALLGGDAAWHDSLSFEESRYLAVEEAELQREEGAPIS